MRALFFSVLVILALVPLAPSILSDPLDYGFSIPTWVKNTAGWWSDDKIPDSSFIETIEFLIKDEMIIVEIPDLDSEVANEIPLWVKNTAGWWSEDKIHDITFVSAIKYLMSQGIIHVEREQIEEAKCNFKGKEVTCPSMKHTEEIKEFHIVVNGGDCCFNWTYVGKQYVFQVETFDEYRGSPIDDVAITAKIISKDGELRYNFGTISTEDGVYQNSITIPSMDWYAENILSVTAEYNGIEKTVEKEFDVFRAESKLHCVKILCYTINSVSSVVDDGTTLLDAVLGTAIYTIGGSTYVVAASEDEHGIEIIDISDPTSPTSVGRLADDGSKLLNKSVDVAIWYDTEQDHFGGGGTYAVVAGSGDDGIAIIDISDPTNPVYSDGFEDQSGSGCDADDNSKTCLAHVSAVAIVTLDTFDYIVGAGYNDDGIEILDLQSGSPVQAGRFSDTTPGSNGCTTGTVCLDNPNDVAIATIGSKTYAVVAAARDDGIAIIDISTPSSPTHVISIADDATRELEQTFGVAIATIGDSTYVVAVGYLDDGIAIIDISTPASPVYVSELEDGTHTGRCSAANGERCLNGPTSVAVETIKGLTYAIVTSKDERAVTIIDITTPSNPTIVAMMYDDNDKMLSGAKAVSIATIGGSTYAVVSGWSENGIEIIKIMHSYS